MRKVAAAVVVFAVLGASPALGASKVKTAKIRKGPPSPAFYTPPSKLPGKKHGDLIWARSVPAGAALPDAGANQNVLYRSTSITSKAIAESGSVAIPKGKAPKGGWPVVTWAHGTTGIADQCAPSRPDAGRRVAARGHAAEGRLRGRQHRLRGARHAGHPPVPDRRLRGPLGARHRPRRAAALPRQAVEQHRDLRPLAGRPVGDVGRVPGADVDAGAQAQGHGAVRARVAPRGPDRAYWRASTSRASRGSSR